jgi:hypothetical protein
MREDLDDDSVGLVQHEFIELLHLGVGQEASVEESLDLLPQHACLAPRRPRIHDVRGVRAEVEGTEKEQRRVKGCHMAVLRLGCCFHLPAVPYAPQASKAAN